MEESCEPSFRRNAQHCEPKRKEKVAEETTQPKERTKGALEAVDDSSAHILSFALFLLSLPSQLASSLEAVTNATVLKSRARSAQFPAKIKPLFRLFLSAFFYSKI